MINTVKIDLDARLDPTVQSEVEMDIDGVKGGSSFKISRTDFAEAVMLKDLKKVREWATLDSWRRDCLPEGGEADLERIRKLLRWTRLNESDEQMMERLDQQSQDTCSLEAPGGKWEFSLR